MDSNANLAEQRRIAYRLANSDAMADDMTPARLAVFQQDVERLAELVQALDEWISNGGALPDAWISKRSM